MKLQEFWFQKNIGLLLQDFKYHEKCMSSEWETDLVLSFGWANMECLSAHVGEVKEAHMPGWETNQNLETPVC